MLFFFAKTGHLETIGPLEGHFAVLEAFFAEVALDQRATAARNGAQRSDGMGDFSKG